MKAKTIKKALDSVFTKFVNSIEDENVKKLVSKNSIITGGSIVSMLLNEPINDYDIYFTNRETVVAVSKYYVNRFIKQSDDEWDEKDLYVDDSELDRVKIFARSEGIAINKGVDSENKDIYEPVCLTSNAISLTNDIQLVIRFYGDAEEIHKNYDYIHATNYWTSSDGNLVLPQAALESILTKDLIYSGSKYPLCSIIRSKKFIKRGWQISAGQYLKMALQLNELDLHNVDVLEEQLMGVDSAYFSILIGALKEKKKKDGNLDGIDNNYIFTLIENIFE